MMFVRAMEYEDMSLYKNIHAKRKRIKAGSGEKMRKPGTNDVYFPESNIRIGKAIVRREAANVKRGMFITAFSSEGYQPSTNNPTMSRPNDSSSCVCWISAMKLYQV